MRSCDSFRFHRVPRNTHPILAFPMYLASLVFVSAIVAESAGFRAVGKHPSGVVVALASLRPSVAVGVFVKAVGSVTAVAAIAAAIAATSAATAW